MKFIAGLWASGPATLLLRLEHLLLATGARGFEGTVERIIYRGGYWEAFVRVPGVDQPMMMPLNRRAAAGDLLRLDVLRGWVLSD